MARNRPTLAEAQAYCRRLARSHYENFTVASWLLPAELRPHFCSIYAYCRWSDDLADETAGGPASLELLDWWQSHTVGGVEVTLVPARHWSMRAPWNRNDGLWGGFVYRALDGSGVAYHSGDTALFDGFAEIGRRVGPIDWAMLPIGAYEPRWFMEPQHMNPEDAAEAFVRLGANTLVAMHWGTFKLTDEPLGEPPRRIRKLFADRGLADDRLWIFDVGETRALTRP